MFARAFWSWAQLLVSRQKRICNFWLHKSTRPCACHNIPYFTTWQHGIRFEESVDFWWCIRPLQIILYKITVIIETFTSVHSYIYYTLPGLHKLCYPTIRDRSTWSKFGAYGEHGDVFLFSNLGALWFSENLFRYSLDVCLREVKNNLFSFIHPYLQHFS